MTCEYKEDLKDIKTLNDYKRALNAGVSAECIDSGGNILTRYSPLEVFEHALNLGVDPNIIDDYGCTPIFHVFEDEKIDLLIKSGANMTHRNYKKNSYIDNFYFRLSTILESKNLHLHDLMNPKVNDECLYHLQRAQKKHLQYFKKNPKMWQDIDLKSQYNPTISRAIGIENLKDMEDLGSSIFDNSKNNSTIIALMRDKECVDYLLQRGVSKEISMEDLLHSILIQENQFYSGEIASVIESFIDKGMDVNARTNNKDSTLFSICYKPENLKVFLDNGADLSIIYEDGKTLLEQYIDSQKMGNIGNPGIYGIYGNSSYIHEKIDLINASLAKEQAIMIRDGMGLGVKDKHSKPKII